MAAPVTWERHYKVVLVGEYGMGKSSLLSRFVDGMFPGDRITQGSNDSVTVRDQIDTKSKVIQVNGSAVKLTVCDPTGHEKYRSVTANFYRGADGAMLIYAINSQDAFEQLSSWKQDIDRYTFSANCILVGTKSDLGEDERKVDPEQAKAYAQNMHVPFVVTSAKTGSNVEEAFASLVGEMQRSTDPEHSRSIIVDLPKNTGAKRCENSTCNC